MSYICFVSTYISHLLVLFSEYFCNRATRLDKAWHSHKLPFRNDPIPGRYQLDC